MVPCVIAAQLLGSPHRAPPSRRATGRKGCQASSVHFTFFAARHETPLSLFSRLGRYRLGGFWRWIFSSPEAHRSTRCGEVYEVVSPFRVSLAELGNQRDGGDSKPSSVCSQRSTISQQTSPHVLTPMALSIRSPQGRPTETGRGRQEPGARGQGHAGTAGEAGFSAARDRLDRPSHPPVIHTTHSAYAALEPTTARMSHTAPQFGCNRSGTRLRR